MEMLYSPVSSPLSSGLRASSTDVDSAIHDPPSSDIPTDACDAGSSSTNASSSNITSLDDDDGSADGVGSPSRDSVLSLLGMRFLPVSQIQDSSADGSAQAHASLQPTEAGLQSSSPVVNGSMISLQMPYSSTPSPAASAGVHSAFMSGNAASPSITGTPLSSLTASMSMPCFSLSVLSPASSSPPVIYAPPSPMGHGQQHAYQQPLPYEHGYQQVQPYALQSASSYFSQQQQHQQHQHQPYCPQHHQHHQHHSHHPSCHHHPLHNHQQAYLQQQQGGSYGSMPYTPSSLLLEALMDPEHHPQLEQRVGSKRKAESNALDPMHHHYAQQHQYQQQAEHQLSHHHHDMQHTVHPASTQAQGVVVAARAKKRRVRKTWTERYQQLKEFKQRFGHCKVPKGWSEDPKLARWVCNMRQSRRMGKMKEERVKKLNELGFLWRCEQTGKVIWEEMIDKLKSFQARHGHCRVPMEWPEDPQLAAWVLYVRQRHRANNLSQEKVRELESINFTWNDPMLPTTTISASVAAPDHYTV